MDRNAAIGVFDSGVGGLTVAREIMAQMPEEKMIYFGDTARVPYGTKSMGTVRGYCQQIIRFLKSQGVKAIVIACNTATACVLDTVEQNLDVPIIGVIKAGAKTAVDATRNGRIGVIGTAVTIKSGLYTQHMLELRPDIRVRGKACPLFVPLVEEGLLDDPVTDEIACRYLEELKREGVDTLIMGCTHFPLLRSAIQKTMGEGVVLVDPAYETTMELKELLREKNLNRLKPLAKGEEQYRLCTSSRAEYFADFASFVLKREVKEVTCVDIEEY